MEALRTNTTLSGAITINTGGSLIVNTIEAISPIPAIYMHSGLKITSAYGLEVDEIASNSSTNLTIASNCVVGTESTAKNLTVKGLTTTENLTVPGYATVSGLLTTGQTVLCNDLKSSGTGGVKILKSDGGIALQMFDSGTVKFWSNVIVDGNLTVSGTTSFANPYWVAVVINFVGGVPTIVRNGGRYAATSIARVSGQATGIVQFDFPEHPEGTNYLMDTAGVGCYATLYTSVRTSTRIGIVIRDSVSLALVDREVHVLILAY